MIEVRARHEKSKEKRMVKSKKRKERERRKDSSFFFLLNRIQKEGEPVVAAFHGWGERE